MNQSSDKLDDLYRAVTATIKPEPSPLLREIRGLGGGDLADLTVWTLLVTGFIELGVSLIGHELYERIRHNKVQLDHHEKESVDEAKLLLSEVIEHPLLTVPHVDEAAQLQARTAIKKILVDVGRPEEIAAQQAEQTVHLLISGIPASTRARRVGL